MVYLHHWHTTGQLIPCNTLYKGRTANERQRLRTMAKRMRNNSLTNRTISYSTHSVSQTFLLKRWTEEKILCMLKNFSLLEHFATFANDRITPPTHAQRWKNDYGRLPTFPKNSENARRALAKTS